jgi:nucleoside-diphosphate-sugar epimerase
LKAMPNVPTQPTRILFGCGYLGSRVANLWRDAGEHTVTTTRRAGCTPEMIAARSFTAQADVTKPDSLGWISSLGRLNLGGTPPESLLYAIGYDRAGDADIHAVYAGGLRNVLAALPSTVERVIYISTTGVYGSAGGELVDEFTPPDPQRDGGRASLAAERVLADHPLRRRSAVLRLAGIYGPGRVPHLDKLRAGEPLPVPADGWLNLIHVDDAARIVVAVDAWLARQPPVEAPHLFCVSDGCPVLRRNYYAEAARVLGTPPPRFVAPPADSPTAARAAVSRRVSNRKLRELLPFSLQYPSYREGLAAILEAEQ